MAEAARKVVVIDGGYDRYDIEAAVLRGVGASVVLRPCDGDAVRVHKAVVDADAVMVRESPVDAAAIMAMRKCRAIVRYGIGVDNIDLDAARLRRIAVANVPDYGTEEVSDQALALLMAVARRIVTRDGEVRSGAWNIGPAQKMYRLAGKTLGLVGYGRIAAAFARKMRGVGVNRVLVHDPYATLPPEVEATDMDRLCAEADIVSLHAPLTPDTRHILDRRRIGLLRPAAIVVNTARGPLIDEAALAQALQEGRLFGAGLDVFAEEPVARDNPLLRLRNVVVSDHTGWYSEEAIQDLQRKAAEEVARVLAGGTPNNWLNRWQ
ncbi:MAG TPA: C-terminal binding protein [Noviherbaspirillum sp.]|jgi:D-3-phosphoglycerate dehydrogenase|uniref:C-terminal binding protein n=1 Tax=Noviherbaspirillum sp. TaxID=1926288 RepID=UPI002F922D22